MYWRKRNINKQKETRVYCTSGRNENQKIKTESFYVLLWKFDFYRNDKRRQSFLPLPGKRSSAITTALPNAAVVPLWVWELTTALPDVAVNSHTQRGTTKTPTRKIATRMIPTGPFPPGKLPPKKIPTQTIPTQENSHLDNSHPGKFISS